MESVVYQLHGNEHTHEVCGDSDQALLLLQQGLDPRLESNYQGLRVDEAQAEEEVREEAPNVITLTPAIARELLEA